MKNTFFNNSIVTIRDIYEDDKNSTDTYRKIYNIIIEKYQKDIGLYFNDLVTAWAKDCERTDDLIGPTFCNKVGEIMGYLEMPCNGIQMLVLFEKQIDYDTVSLMKKIDNVVDNKKGGSGSLALKISWIIEAAFRDMITEKIDFNNKANKSIQRKLKEENFL